MSRDAELFQLDSATCRTLLQTQHVGRLVTGGDDPHVVPVNYGVVDELVVFHTAAGADAPHRVGERVVFEVDMFDDRTRSGWSVVVHGRLDEASAERDLRPIDTWAPGDRTCTLVISIDSLTGRLLRGPVDAPVDEPSGYL